MHQLLGLGILVLAEAALHPGQLHDHHELHHHQKKIVWASGLSVHPRCSKTDHYLDQYEIALISWHATWIYIGQNNDVLLLLGKLFILSKPNKSGLVSNRLNRHGRCSSIKLSWGLGQAPFFCLGPTSSGEDTLHKKWGAQDPLFFLSGDGEQGLWSLSNLPCAGGGEGGLGRPDWRTLAAPREDGGQVDLPPPQFYWPFGRDTWLGIRSGDMLNCFVIPYATYWIPWYTTVCCSIAFRRKRYVPFSVEWGPYLLFVGRLFVLYPL